MTTPTTPPPDDPAALARELAAEIHQADQDCEYRTLPTERIACILLPTLARLVGERDEAREQWRMSSVCRELQAKLDAAQSAEREARVLLEWLEHTDHYCIFDFEKDCWKAAVSTKDSETVAYGDSAEEAIRKHLARGAEGKPASQGT